MDAEQHHEEVEVVTEQAPSQPVVVQSSSTALKKRKVHKKHVLLVAGIVVLMSVSSAATYFLTRPKTSKSNSTPETTATATDEKGKTTALPEEKKIETKPVSTTYNWQDPKLVQTLPVFDNLEAYYQDSYSSDTSVASQMVNEHKYYQVGTGSDGSKLYVATFPPMGLGGQYILFFVEKSGAYTLYQQHSVNAFYASQTGAEATYQGPKLSSTVTVDSKSVISEIQVKDEISYNKQSLIAKGFFGSTDFLTTATFDNSKYTNGAGYTKLADLSEGTLYEMISSKDTDYKITNFVLLLKNHMSVNYVVNGELAKEKIDPITWSDGTKNADDYQTAGKGCGRSFANEVALKVSLSDLAEIGKSTKGQKVYELKDINNSLFKKHYDEYVSGSDIIAEQYKGLTLQQFKDKRAIYLVQDALDRWLVFSNVNYVPVGGCAKPVVYLYPTLPTLVNVSVDADVTLSDPFYTVAGWQNVLAMPNGKLVYNGQNYDSLFWEGYGRGVYPDITKGKVVKTSDVVTIWRKDLATLNLNQQEINDFVAFWTPKIANKPYTRISWLLTTDMQQLAPLYVSGGVDTTIRVFLDMEGLDQYQDIAPQALPTVQRNGFTVVEWGGLARDGSVPRLH